MNRTLRRLIAIIGLQSMLALFHGDATAHVTTLAIVPRLPPGVPEPLLNGTCGAAEYSRARRYSLLYRPRLELNPATIYLLASTSNFYVCVSGLPISTPTVDPFISVILDTHHDGGSLPGTDDFYFRFYESAHGAAYRGDGLGGLVGAPEVAGWDGFRADGADELTWSAELRIPLASVGGGAPLTVAGIQVRHNLQITGSDNFAWPSRAQYTVPNTWADLVWGEAPAGDHTIREDVSRITQGLELDSTGGVFYDRIAGKDTLVRAQLYQLGTPASVSTAVCKVQQTTEFNIFGGRRPVTQPIRNVPVSFGAAPPELSSIRYGYFTGRPAFDCWIPGNFLDSPGDYHVWMEVRLDGDTTAQTIELGSRPFVGAADLRFLLFRWMDAESAPRFQRWDDGMIRSLSQSMSEVQRMLPMRASIGPFDFLGAPPTGSRPGVRFFTHPTIFQFTPESLGSQFERERQTWAFRVRAFEILQEQNAALRALDAADHHTRDRFDLEHNLLASTMSPGGATRPLNGRWSGESDIDPYLDGISGSVVAHEASHCLEQVRTASPHTDCTCSAAHTRTVRIPTFGVSFVDMLRRVDRPAFALMYLGVDRAPYFLHEGWEWNDLRRTVLSLPAGGLMAASRAGQPLFKLAGTLDPNDQVSIITSAQVDDRTLDLTPMDQTSPYSLVFVGGGEIELGRLPFDASSEGPDDGIPNAPGSGLFLVAPIPDGSKGIELRKDKKVLHAQTFSPNAPVVSSVSVSANQEGSGFLVAWSATDADHDNLTYSVWLEISKDRPRILLVSGLTEKSYIFDPDVLLGVPRASIIVEATDGYNTGRAGSSSFALPPAPPYLINILSPSANAELVAGQPILLSGTAFERGTGSVEAEALRWSVDQGTVLGDGKQLEVVLEPGVHVISAADSASGRGASLSSVTVTVLADSDGDGLPNTFEAQHSCLSPSESDAGDDPDADGLASSGEWRRGTDPCSPDSDLDGIGDGDEVLQDSDPLKSLSVPSPDLLFLSGDDADFGSCPSPMTVLIGVQTDSPTPWSATSSADWLTTAEVGTGDGTLTLKADCTGLAPGSYRAQVLVHIDGGQPRLVTAQLRVPEPVVTDGRVTNLAYAIAAAAVALSVRRRRSRTKDSVATGPL